MHFRITTPDVIYSGNVLGRILWGVRRKGSKLTKDVQELTSKGR